MRVEKTEIRNSDLEDITLAFAQVVDPKMQRVWSGLYRQTPLPFFHNGLLCRDIDTGARFTQLPYHPTQTHQARSVVLLDGALAVFQLRAFPKYATEFVSRKLWPRIFYVSTFAAESIAQSGDWCLPTLEGARVYAKFSAITH